MVYNLKFDFQYEHLNTLNQISTGKKENKFGVDNKTFQKLVNYCKNSKNINLKFSEFLI